MSSLGQGPDHVMDAISECELVVRNEGGREQDAPWQLHYRKEMFSPWHDFEFDDVATELIYRQIIQAVHANEYQLRSVSSFRYHTSHIMHHSVSEIIINKSIDSISK